MKQALAAITIGAAAAAVPMIGAEALPTISAGSTINFTGNATFNSSAVAFVSPGDLKAGTGDFVALGTCVSCVTISTPFTYNPFTATPDLFDVVNGALAASVDILSEADAPLVNKAGTALIISDNVELHLTGFEATPGVMTITVNQDTHAISGSFSATGEAVQNAPEPMSLALMGVGLVGLGLVRAHKKA